MRLRRSHIETKQVIDLTSVLLGRGTVVVLSQSSVRDVLRLFDAHAVFVFSFILVEAIFVLKVQTLIDAVSDLLHEGLRRLVVDTRQHGDVVYQTIQHLWLEMATVL